MTTPTTAKHPPLLDDLEQQPAIATPARRTRGRAATVSRANDPPPPLPPLNLSFSGSEGITKTATSGRRRRATTVSRPQPPPIPSLPTATAPSAVYEMLSEEVEQQFVEETHKQQQQLLNAEQSHAPFAQQQHFSPVSEPIAENQYHTEHETVMDKQPTAVQHDMTQQQQQQISDKEQSMTLEQQEQHLATPDNYHAVAEQKQSILEQQHADELVSLGTEKQHTVDQPTMNNVVHNEKQTSTSEYHTLVEQRQQQQGSMQPITEAKIHATGVQEEDPIPEQQKKELPPLPPCDSNSVSMATTKSTASGSTSDHESVRSTSSEYNGRSRSDSLGAKSFSSFNPFKRAGSPSSTRTGTRAVERPSAAFRERQSKRMSEFYRFQSQPSSPSTSFQTSNNRLSYASASSYYDMLMSKFGRSSEDHHHHPSPSGLIRHSPKHTALKDEAQQHIGSLKTTDPDHDYDFWEVFINDTDEMIRSQPDSVKHHMIAGIPPSLRGYVWQIMSKSRNNGELESEYRELLKRISPHEKSIQRDLARTFPTHDFFKERDGEGQESLFNVTKAYSIFDQQVGYCQGLPFIVGCLLLHMPDDMAFCVLIKLMSQYGLRAQFMPQMELLHERLYQFEHILQQKLPQIHKHLETQGVQPSMYASQWFLTLFASRCPLHLAYRVFDMVLLEGSHVVLRFALALMFRNQHTLLNLEFEALVEFLNNAIFDTYKDDESGFVHDAYSMDVPTRLLTRLAKQHATEAAREAKAQSQEENLRRINTELSSHVRRLEKSYRNLENEHQEVTRQVIDAKMNVARMDDENQQLRWQLSQAKTEIDQLKASMPVVDDLQRQNKQLTQKNGHLENQLEDVEAVLISLKMKYAESESAYEGMKQKLHKAGIF
ncbi:rab-GTPase-TBC domain-containing protein [Zychaea mexicana]|uniref:rab-GTPase-TBC domain-containing protein n=1 Tax=Zychaea mexicana TaxID=64656 RepID=UPI0022FEB646|nr:rab-GTPase-TBC domain-containing protein [Zychaea mexicana]KAI9495066.1 rab-GTPase-TBC domain-containing protein [Zychaea mexicana]